jgi:hypothetical protein
MVLLAKRVSEKLVEEKMTSISSTVENFLIFSKICSAWDWVSIVAPAVGNWQLAIGKISFGPPVGADFSGQRNQHSLSSQGVVCGLRDGLRQVDNLSLLPAKGDTPVRLPNRKRSAENDATRYSPAAHILLQYSQG